MKTIKINLLEKLIVGSFLPFCATLLTFFMLIITLVGREYKNLKIILVLFILSILLLSLVVGIIVVVEKYNKNQIELYDEYLLVKTRVGCEKIFFHDIKLNYYPCKWYMIPLVPIIKKGNSGILEIKNSQGKAIITRILYHDFRKLEKMIDSTKINLLKD